MFILRGEGYIPAFPRYPAQLSSINLETFFSSNYLFVYFTDPSIRLSLTLPESLAYLFFSCFSFTIWDIGKTNLAGRKLISELRLDMFYFSELYNFLHHFTM